MTTTTEHLKALLINDGREFAMVRKADLAALLQIAETDPNLGRYLDPLGVLRSEVRFLQGRDDRLNKRLLSMLDDAYKHGEERRRYMANNKALLARCEQLEREGSKWYQEYVDTCTAYHSIATELEKTVGDMVSARVKLRNFKRKFPAIGTLMDMTP